VAARHQLGGAHLEVEVDLVAHLVVDRGAAEREPEGAADAGGEQGAPGHRRRPYAVRSAANTASA
jgi:hypothetical protein